MEYEKLRKQLEESIHNGSYDYIEAATNKPIVEVLKDIEEAQLIHDANEELKKRNHFLFLSTIGLGLICLSLIFSSFLLFTKGSPPDCNVHRFNTNNQGEQCYGNKCFK